VTWGREGFKTKLLQMYMATKNNLHRLFYVSIYCKATKGIQEMLGDPDKCKKKVNYIRCSLAFICSGAI
jgi:hypothetical protein